MSQRRKFNSQFKFKVVLDALSERLPLHELAKKHDLHPNQITTWKKEFLRNGAEILSKEKASEEKKGGCSIALQSDRPAEDGDRFFKKSLVMRQSVSERKTHIGKAEKISVKKQCELLHISRSSHYYQKVPESDFNLTLMEMIDREFMEHPWKGVPRMVQWLNKDCGLSVNKKRVERLYRVMGVSAAAPGPSTSKKGKGKGHKVFPYLLKNLPITHPNQVWAMDITYIPVRADTCIWPPLSISTAAMSWAGA